MTSAIGTAGLRDRRQDRIADGIDRPAADHDKHVVVGGMSRDLDDQRGSVRAFYAPLAGIRPGEVALLSVGAGGPVKLHTGVMVTYADDESFTLMTPEGHVLAAWITFSARRDQDGTVIAQAQALERTNDPLFELGYLLPIARRMNDRFWEQTLEAVAGHHGVEATCQTTVVCVDRRRQWRYAGNIRHSVAFRSALHTAKAPLRWLRRSS
ncbi:MAG: DUF1990 family protein [Chloroflexota bacterium]|nr:DUF1990 family protein [Chloroflexota bacterium]